MVTDIDLDKGTTTVDTRRWEGPNTTCSFSFTHYRQMLQKLKSQGYTFYTCKQFASVEIPQEPYIILRHDIEYYPEKAVEFARIEKELEIQSTFFFRVHAKEYNLFNFKYYTNLKEIASLGHEIGLHAETMDFAHISGENPNDVIIKEKEYLSFLLGKSIWGVSPHGDLSEYNNIDFWKENSAEDFGFMYMAYEDYFFNSTTYISDSLGRWKQYPNKSKQFHPISCLCQATSTKQNIYVLIHPRTWYTKAYFLEY